MPGHYGLRSKTRTLFKKAYRTKGMKLNTFYLFVKISKTFYSLPTGLLIYMVIAV